MNKPPNQGQRRHAIGEAGELRALDWLEGKGLMLVERNFKARRGEIDLIMRDGEYLVFIEVRVRSQLAMVGAAASVDQAKRKAVVSAAQAYLATHPAANRLPCRFDVVALGDTDAQSEWLKNAFDASGW